MNYFSIPSTSPLSRKEAIKEARGRNWSDTTHEGLCWQGEHGATQYLRVAAMTDSERKYLKRHLL